MAKILGIFQGKQKTYNSLILKSLLTGSKTTMQIAEFICENSRELKFETNRKNEVRKIYSVIAREGSRLDELTQKQYITRKGLMWNLTLKGMCVSLTLFETIDEIKDYNTIKEFINVDELNSILTRFIKSLEKKNSPLASIVKSSNLMKAKKRIEKNMGSLQYWELILWNIRNCTEGMVKRGADIDGMSISQVEALIANELAFKVILA